MANENKNALAELLEIARQMNEGNATGAATPKQDIDPDDSLQSLMGDVAKKKARKAIETSADEVLQRPDGVEILFNEFKKTQDLVSAQNPEAQATKALASPPAVSTEPAQAPVSTPEIASPLASPDQKKKLNPAAFTPGNILQHLLGFAGLEFDTSQQRLAKAQAGLAEQKLEQGGEKGIQAAKAKASFELEKFKQNRLDERERIKAQLDFGDPTSSLKLVVSDVANLFEAREKVAAKGRLLPGATGVVGGIVGFDRADRAAVESFAETLKFSFGDAILAQKGRAFTEKEQKAVEKKIINAGLTKSNVDFEAKMNVILKQVNERIKRTSKVPNPQLFPEDVRELIKQKQSQQTQSGVPQVTPEQRAAFNAAREAGASIDEARQKAGF